MKKKTKSLVITCFCIGLVLYLCGLFLLFGSSLSKLGIMNNIIATLSNSNANIIKLVGIILFMIGFLIFMISIILLYKDNNIVQSNKELIIEGKADVITIIVMTYVMIFMLVICLIFDQVIGALLFGVTILIQSTLNAILIKYFGKNKK
ncbi:MAG: hypothetical protein ACI4WW_00510 [Candidatus Coprovivens sp.]